MNDPVQREMIALLPRLRRFAYALTGSMPDADDLVQSTCERAIRSIERWRPGTRLDSWMFRIAQNLHFNNIRDGKLRQRHVSAVDADHIADAVADRTAEARLTLDAVRRMLWRLPEEQKAVVVLVCVEGFSYKEVAQMLEISVGTVASRLARGRETLTTLMEGAPNWPEGGPEEIDR